MKPKLNKKLSLNRETVRELTDSQLDLAAGQSGGDSVEVCCLSRAGCNQSVFTYICNSNNPCPPHCHA
jgi:hypothetical protein